jgi:mycoredoxin
VTDTEHETEPDSDNVVTVYWRPGCPYCSALRFGLRRAEVPVRAINIWDDPSAAEFVRSVAGGNETVPTVTVGSVSVVNPSARQVVALVHSAFPGLLAPPADNEPHGLRRMLRRQPLS